MAYETSLLERIAAGKRDAKVDLDASLVAASVLGHLERLFNVRQGNVATRPDYGLPDINSLVQGFPDASAELRRAIKRAIDEFEPRLSGTVVAADSTEGDAFQLRFRISAKLAARGLRQGVSFTTRVDNEGKLTVED
jgi:type VI secretion system protein